MEKEYLGLKRFGAEKEYLGLRRFGAENTGDGGGGGQAVLGRRGSALITKCCNLHTYIIHEI